MPPYFFKWRGRPVFAPYFFGGRHFCTNGHGIHWMIGAIFVEFSQLILDLGARAEAAKVQPNNV